MKRIAIPVTNGTLSEYFGDCNHYEIFEIDRNTIINNEIDKPERKELMKLPEWITQMNITDVIAYKIEASIIDSLSGKKIDFFIGIPMKTPKKITSISMLM